MRVLFINSVCGIGSTGRICTGTAEKYEADGHEVKIAYGRGEVLEQYQRMAVRIGTGMSVRLHGLRTRLLDEHGFGSKRATREFLRWADSYDPDLLWLHNIHGYYINIEMLFAWIKKRPQMQVKWTLHDCWAFTGHCAHFTVVKCDKWKSHCEHCCQKSNYPASYCRDNSFQNFERKRAAFTGVENLTIITPSRWLSELVKQSILKEYPVKVINNTVDTNVFKPTPSDFRERYGLQNKKIVLGVASNWSDRKGLDDFIELAKMLDDRYAIVLVGLNKKQISDMPKRIVGLQRTNNTEELAAVYTAADVFVNPSKEETFGMTTLEAVSCGTKGIVYEGTACAEVMAEKGSVVPQDVNLLHDEIVRICARGGKTECRCIVICIQKTGNTKELAEIYTAADVFVNPTHEDTYPTVNLEARACGTPVITYDTGGSGEAAGESGIIVEARDTEALYQAVVDHTS